MMIPININVKESAYDKVMYFLSHLKDDVTFVVPKKVEREKNVSTDVLEFRRLSKKISKVEKDIDILSLEKEINSDIF